MLTNQRNIFRIIKIFSCKPDTKKHVANISQPLKEVQNTIQLTEFGTIYGNI